MDTLKQQVSKIKLARTMSLSDEQIMQLLDLKQAPDAVLAAYEESLEYYSSSEALEKLKPYLGNLKNEASFRTKLLRLVKEGEIKAVKEKGTKGWRFHKEEVRRYIENSQKTPAVWAKEVAEWKKRASTYQRLYEELALETGRTPLDPFPAISSSDSAEAPVAELVAESTEERVSQTEEETRSIQEEDASHDAGEGTEEQTRQ